jgi:hypothetical protein
MRRLIPMAVALTLTACAVAFPTAPVVGTLRPVPAVDVDAWIASLRPSVHTSLRFNWTLNQDEGKGRGSVAIAPRDSLYFDYRAPLGSHPGSAFVLGDTAVWAEPQSDVERLVPSYELLWGLVGVARPPRAGWKVDGRRDAVGTRWRYIRGADTTDYVLWKGDGISSLQTTVSIDGKRIGRVVTVFDASRHPVKARLEAQINPARLDLTFDNPSKPLTFDREMWLAPRPQ